MRRSRNWRLWVGVSPPTNFCQRARISAMGNSGNLAICAATDGGVENDVLIWTP